MKNLRKTTLISAGVLLLATILSLIILNVDNGPEIKKTFTTTNWQADDTDKTTLVETQYVVVAPGADHAASLAIKTLPGAVWLILSFLVALAIPVGFQLGWYDAVKGNETPRVLFPFILMTLFLIALFAKIYDVQSHTNRQMTELQANEIIKASTNFEKEVNSWFPEAYILDQLDNKGNVVVRSTIKR